MTNTVAIYTRVSKEDLDEPLSTRRQERACRAFALSKGWDIARVWEDVDISAYEKGTRRPAFEELTKVVAGGRVNGVVVWKLDRLVRRAADFERFWARCDKAGVFLSSATEPIDSTTELGLAVIRILVTFANVESTTIGLRLQARMEEKARAGIPLNVERVYGYTLDFTQIIESEAEHIRDGAQRVLQGETLRSVVADWEARGIHPPRGPWTIPKLGRLLRSPRLAGHNTFHGEVVKEGCLPAILDPVTSAQLRSALAHPRRKRAPAKDYPLRGVLRCAKCGMLMNGASTNARLGWDGLPGERRYRCP